MRLAIDGWPKTFIFAVLPVALTVMAAIGPLQAHEFWLDMADSMPKPGARVPVVHRTGQNFLGDSFPYLRASAKRFTVIDGKGERAIKAIEGDDPAADVAFPNAGLATVVFERNADKLVHPTLTRLMEVIDGEGVEHVPELHKRLGLPETGIRENYARFAKALVKVGDGKGRDRAVGLPFEIVVEGNPYELAAGAAIPVQVLHEGRAVQNVLVKGFYRADGTQPKQARTNAEGRAVLEGVPAGDVLLSAVIMMPADRRAGAEWTSLWASVTFRRP